MDTPPSPTPSTTSSEDPRQQGQDFIAETHNKLTRIARDFANGDLNQIQFQQLYDHYQYQIVTVARLLAEGEAEDWQQAVQVADEATPDELRRSLTARVIGFALYAKETGLPIEAAGGFATEPELIVPMLSNFHTAIVELLENGLDRLRLSNGHWLYFFEGQYATLIVLFSLEAAANQLPVLRDLLNDYETANHAKLKQTTPDKIALPFANLLRRTGLMSQALKRQTQD